jgi:AAA domain
VHLALGLPWLGLAVPRPLRIVIIENEGPRGPFRRKLRRKLAAWNGLPWADGVRVLEEPWGEFTFGDDTIRSRLARRCAEFGADMLVIGPLVTVGAEGGGTPEEVARFEGLVADFRAEVGRSILVWIAHHENKAGDVSGAWERLPDTLMHTRIEGRTTKLHWRKARWSSCLHDQHWTLKWKEPGEGFERHEEPERDVRAEILALYEGSPGWRTVSDVASKHNDGGIGRRRGEVERELEALVEEGRFEREQGPEGRSKRAVCYRPAELVRASGQVGQVAPSAGAEVLVRPTPRREGGTSTDADQAELVQTPGQVRPDGDA